MASSLDHVYRELAPVVESLRPSCQSHSLLPLPDVISLLQRLSACQPKDLLSVVIGAPELHCFIALQDASQSNFSQRTDCLDRVQLQVVESMCGQSGGREAPIASCRRALRTIFSHYASNEVSVKLTVKLLSECAKDGHWDIAKLIVGCLCQHMNGAELGGIEQKVLGTLRDSLVQYGVCCLAVLLEPLHKLIFLHLNALMVQGTTPEESSIPPAIKWYLRLLRKCSGKATGDGTQPDGSKITKTDLQFLFWPFIPAGTESHRFELPQRTVSGETRDWSSRFGKGMESWRDNLCNMLHTELRMSKTRSTQAPDEETTGYKWLPFSDYILNPDEWTGLHDLLLHNNSGVKDLESRITSSLEASATGARTLGLGAALVDLLAQETRTCNCHETHKSPQQARPKPDITRRSNPARECCGCIHQGSKGAGNAGTLLIRLLRPITADSCDISTWALIFKNMMLAVPATSENLALRYLDASSKHLTARISPCWSQIDSIPLPAIHSTFVTLIQNEKDSSVLRGRKGVVGDHTEALKQAKKSRWRLEQVVWPTLTSHTSRHNFSFAYYRGFEVLAPFGLQHEDSSDILPEDAGPFPLLELPMGQFLEIVKCEPQYMLPLLKFIKADRRLTAVGSFKQGGSETLPSSQDRDPLQLDLHTLQQELFVAAVHHCVLQDSGREDLRLDDLCLRVATFSGGSFRYLFGECGELLDTCGEVNTRKSGRLGDDPSFFGKGVTRERGVTGEAGLATSFEGRLFLAWQLKRWAEEASQGAPSGAEEAGKHLPKFESLKTVCSLVSGLHSKFPHVDAWVSAGLSALWQALSVQVEDALWHDEFESPPDNKTGKGARSAKRPRLSSWTSSILVNSAKTGEQEKEEPEWIVEAICRSSGSLEKYLPIYLGLNITADLRVEESEGAGSKRKAPSGALPLRRQNLVNYLTTHPSKIPNLATLCGILKVREVAWEAIRKAAASDSVNHGFDVFELWFQFLDKYREIDSSARSFTNFLEHDDGILASMTQCALLSPCVVRSWPQDLLGTLVTGSLGMVRRICEEARRYIESMLAADDTSCMGLQGSSVDFIFSGVILAIDKNPKAVAEYMEATLAAECPMAGESAKLSPTSRSSFLDLVSMVFALCKPDGRRAVLSHLGNSDLYKSCFTEGLNEIPSTTIQSSAWMLWGGDQAKEGQQNKQQPPQIWHSFALAMIFWNSKSLEDTSVKHPQSGLSERRAAICHVLATSPPQLQGSLPGGDNQSAGSRQNPSPVSCEGMIYKLEALSSPEDNLSLHPAVNSWILLCCRMSIRLNLEHVGAFCRLHPGTVRDPLICRIEEDLADARKLGGEGLGWETALQELRAGFLQGFLAWLPLDGRSHFTTKVANLPNEFWAEASTGVYQEQIISCLQSNDVGVRRSAYSFVVAHQHHHHHFVVPLALELCKRVLTHEPTGEQEALLGILMPILVHDPVHGGSVAVDSVVMILEEAKKKAVSLQSCVKGPDGDVPCSEAKRHAEALLRVARLACQASPPTFATEKIVELLTSVAEVQGSDEGIAVGALRCLAVLAADLPTSAKLVTLVQDLILHLHNTTSGDYVWHLAMSCGERFASGLGAGARIEENPTPHERPSSGLPRAIGDDEIFASSSSLRRAVPLRALLARLRAPTR